MGELRGAVAGGEAVAADDRHHHDPPHARVLAGRLQVAGSGGEERRGRLLLGRRPGRRIDNDLGARQGVRQTVAGDDVDAFGARDRDDLVSSRGEHVDEMQADSSGRARYRDLPA